MKAKEIFKKLFFVAGCAAFVCAVNVTDSHALNVPATASGAVIAPLQVTKNSELDLGSFIAGGAGKVTVAASGSNSWSSDNVAIVQVASSAPKAAKFTVTGEAGYTYSVSFDADTITLKKTGDNTKTMSLALSKSLAGNGTLTGGTDIFYVGGDLTVADSQTPGSYTGSWGVNVNYN